MSLGTLAKPAMLIIVMLSAESLIHAGPITYTEQATASGSLGSTPFSSALVTITFTGDTANVTGGSGFFANNVGTATVNVSGIGTATFTSGLEVFDNQVSTPTAAAGIALNGGGSILDTF